MNRTFKSFMAVTLVLAAGCGRGENVVVDKNPAVVVDASKSTKPIPQKAGDVAEPTNEERRKNAEDLERKAHESKKADKDPVYSCNMMWAATAWMKADDKAKALAAAKTAIAAGPDDRGSTYTFLWYTNIADVLANTGELPLAIAHFEAAVKAAPDPISLARTQKKLDDVKAKLGNSK